MWLHEEDLFIAGEVREDRLPEVEKALKAAGVKYIVQKMLLYYSILVDNDNKEVAYQVLNRWKRK